MRFASAPIPHRGEERSDRRPPSGNTVFVGGLSYQSSKESVEEFFSKCGNIANIRIATNEDGRPRGFAHVEFDSEDAVKSALELTGKRLDGREIRVDVAGNKGGRSGGRFDRDRGHGRERYGRESRHSRSRSRSHSHHDGSRERHGHYHKGSRYDD